MVIEHEEITVSKLVALSYTECMTAIFENHRAQCSIT